MKKIKKFFERTMWWIRWGRYQTFWGLPIGLATAIITFIYFRNIWISVACFIVFSLVAMIIIQMRGIDKYAKEYAEFNKKDRSIDPKDLRGFSKNLDKLLDLDKELVDFFNKYSTKTYFEPELNKQWKIHGDYFVKKAKRILSSMNNQELMYGLLGTEQIKDIVDFFDYFKPYIPDIEYLKKHPEKAKEYYYENLMQIDAIQKNSINEYYFKVIMNLNYFEDIEKIILSQMSNKDLMELAESSKTWFDKLYYYGFIKSDKKDKNDSK